MISCATMPHTHVALSRDAAIEIKRLYEERGPTGRRLYSYRDLARQFACSETTILRVIRGLATFMDLPTPKEQEAMKADAAASLKKLLEMQSNPAPEAPLPQPAPTEEADDGLTEAQRKRLAQYGHGRSS